VAGVRIGPGPGAGRRGPYLDFGTRKDPSQVRLADLDHDGHVDLVIEHEARSVFDVSWDRSVPTPTAVLTSLVEARVSAERVRLLWHCQEAALTSARVERTGGGRNTTSPPGYG